MAALLELNSITAAYGNKETLRNVTVNVQRGEIVAVVGHNGAGKTTLLSAILGVVSLRNGTITLDGKDITTYSTSHRVKLGICLVPQGIGVFNDLSVTENLRVIAHLQGKRKYASLISGAFDFFPALKVRASQMAGSLSGGERQMLSVAMSLVAKPALVMMDEPTLGLSPLAGEEVLHRIREISQSIGCGVLIAEENIYKALSIASRVYIIKLGEIIMEETAEELSKRDQYWELF